MHHGGLSHPGVVVVLPHIAKLGVLRRVERFRIAFGEHDNIRVRQLTDYRVGGEPRQHAFHRVARGLMSENGIEEIALNGEPFGTGDGQFTGRRRFLVAVGDAVEKGQLLIEFE